MDGGGVEVLELVADVEDVGLHCSAQLHSDGVDEGFTDPQFFVDDPRLPHCLKSSASLSLVFARTVDGNEEQRSSSN